MKDKTILTALVIVLVICIILYWAYNNCKLDRYLAPQHQKCKKGGKANKFVGAMAQFPYQVPCAFPESKYFYMNRCNYT